jgi:hypothetical protein
MDRDIENKTNLEAHVHMFGRIFDVCRGRTFKGVNFSKLKSD